MRRFCAERLGRGCASFELGGLPRSAEGRAAPEVLPHNMDMMNMTQPLRRPRAGYGFASAFVLALAMVATGVSSPGGVDGTVSAQALNPCALLTSDEVESLAGNASVGDGVASSLQSFSYVNCRYMWGVGNGRFKLDVIVYDAAGRFPGMSPDQIKQRLLESVKPGTTEAVISDVGEAAVFKSDSPYYATATAFLKGRILAVHLDGLVAREEKDQAIALLKSAASRL
jgi:hypothetical protein